MTPTLTDDLATLDRLLADRTMTPAECEAVARVRRAAEKCEHYERALPRTADGVVVVPGMMLYGFDQYPVGRRVPRGDAMITWADMGDVDEVVIVGDENHPTRSFYDWWADRTKAEAARQAWLQTTSRTTG